MVTQNVKQTFEIPLFNFSHFEEKMTKMQKSAKKLGLEAPTFKVLETKPAIWDTLSTPPQIIKYKRHVVEVEGKFPKIDGYVFVGTVEHTEHGNVLRAAPNQTIGEEFRHVEATCDHCQTKRNRKDTFLVLEEKTGLTKRIGRACVKDYLGGVDPETLALMCTIVKECSYGDPDADDYERNGGKRLIPTSEFLAYCIMEVENCGYFISSAKAKETPGVSSTAQSALNEYSAFMRKSYKGWKYPTMEQLNKADVMLKWAQELSPKNPFEENLKIISHKTFLERRDYGIIAAITVSYAKAEEFLAKRQAEIAKNKEECPSAYVGEVGKRIDLKVFVYKIMKFDGAFGTVFIYLMRDEKGNEFVWKGSGGLFNVDVYEGDKVVESFQNGVRECEEAYEIRGTVKGHQEYKGKKQTLLTRVKFADVKTTREGAAKCANY